MTPVLTIPYDDHAEREVIGCAVGTAEGYRIAAEHVAADAFYTPRYARVFAACAQLANVDDDVLYANRRIRLAARAAGVDEAEVRRLVDDRSRFHDRHGEYARRVADAARRRRALAAAAERTTRWPPERTPTTPSVRSWRGAWAA